MARKTSFEKWLEHCELSASDAGERLGLERQRIQELINGKAYSKERGPAKPDLATRFAMAAIAAGLQIDRKFAVHESSRRDRRLLLALTAARRGLDPWPDED